MSGFTVWKCGFCERRMCRKNQKIISCQVCVTSYQKSCTQISGRNFNLVSRNNANCYLQSCYGLSNLLGLMKLNFPIIGLSEHKIGLNSDSVCYSGRFYKAFHHRVNIILINEILKILIGIN